MSPDASCDDLPVRNGRTAILLAWTIAGTFIWFYGFVPRFGLGGQSSVLRWLYEQWDYHYLPAGWIGIALVAVPLIVGVRRMRAEGSAGTFIGSVWLTILAFLLCYFGVRMNSPRLTAVSLPLLLLAATHFVFGSRRSNHLRFPMLFWAALVTEPPTS